MDAAYDPAAWSDFAVAVAGAAAALAGLLFVSMSINVKEIVAGPNLPARAAGAVVTLTTPLVIAVLVLTPGQSNTTLGIEITAVGALVGIALTALYWPREREHQTMTQWFFGTAFPAIVLVAAAVLAGVGVLGDSLGGLYWLPVLVIAAIVGSLAQAWVLLIEILR